jgi:hypothetical protein
MNLQKILDGILPFSLGCIFIILPLELDLLTFKSIKHQAMQLCEHSKFNTKESTIIDGVIYCQGFNGSFQELKTPDIEE